MCDQGSIHAIMLHDRHSVVVPEPTAPWRYQQGRSVTLELFPPACFYRGRGFC